MAIDCPELKGVPNAQEVLAMVDERAQRDGTDHGTAGRAILEEEKRAAAIRERASLFQAQASLRQRATLTERGDRYLKQFGKEGLYRAVENDFYGLSSRGTDKLSIEAQIKGRLMTTNGEVVRQLDKEGLLKAANRPGLQRDIAREMEKAGSTQNKPAARVAEILAKSQEDMRLRLNDKGASIGKLDGYTSRTSHDPVKIFRGGFEKWRGTIEPLLTEDMFRDVPDKGKFLRGVWAALSSGTHLTHGGEEASVAGSGNMARRLSASRVLQFKNADGWMDYQAAYGTPGSLLEKVMRGNEHAARAEALMDRYGPNPEAGLDRSIDFLRAKYRDSNPEAVGHLTNNRDALLNRFKVLDGTASKPSADWGPRFLDNTRAVLSMAKLGGVVLSHLSSIATKQSLMRELGLGVGEQWTNAYRSIFEGLSSSRRRALADLHLSHFEGMQRDLMSRFTLDDSVPGIMSRVANQYYRATGLTWMLGAQKTGMMSAVARHLGTMVDRTFDQLSPETQEMLRSYRISPANWETIRTAQHATLNGRAHVTPHDGGEDTQLALKLHSMFADVADKSTVTPGVRERGMAYGGTQKGTLSGELARSVMQFKMWPLAAVNQILAPLWQRGDVAGIMMLAAHSAVIGTMIAAMKSVTAGKDPRPFNDYRTWMAGLAQGGGLGIFGDFLFGEFNRNGRSLAETAAGPLLGEASAIANIWNDAKQLGAPTGHPGRVLEAEVVKDAIDNTPFLNMFYARRALDYALFDSLKESINPGYLRRREQALKHSTQQQYIFPPSQYHAHTFGR